MYIINNFVYGHRMFRSPALNNEMVENELSFRTNVNGKIYEVDFPYHGGQVDGDIYSVIMGHLITSDDGNENYTDEMIAVIQNENEYREEYNIFLKRYIENIEGGRGGYGENYDSVLDDLIEYLNNTEPEFYTVQSSS